MKAENPVFVVLKKKTPKKSLIVKDKDKCYYPKSGTKERVRKKKPVKELIEQVDFASLIQGAAGKLSGQKNEVTTKESSSAHKETPVKDVTINESTPLEVDYNGQSTIFDVIREAQERPKSPYQELFDDTIELATLFNLELEVERRQNMRDIGRN